MEPTTEQSIIDQLTASGCTNVKYQEEGELYCGGSLEFTLNGQTFTFTSCGYNDGTSGLEAEVKPA